MNTPYDGGPAFPEQPSGPYPTGEIFLGRPGMSLRAYIATAALQGLLAKGEPVCDPTISEASTAADLLIAELNKEPK